MQGAPLPLKLVLYGGLLLVPAFAWLMPGMWLTLLPLFGLAAVALLGWEFAGIGLVGLIALIPLSPELHTGEAGASVLALQKAGLIGLAGLLIVQRGFSGQFNGPAFAFLLAGVLTIVFGRLHPALGPGDMIRSLMGTLAPFMAIWVRSERRWQSWMILVAAAAPLMSMAASVPLLAVGHRLFGLDQNGVMRFQGAGIPAYLGYLGEIGTYAAFAEYALTGRIKWLWLAAGAFAAVIASGTRVPMATSLLFCAIVLTFARGPNFTVRPRLRLWAIGTAVLVAGALLIGPTLLARTFGASGAGAVNLSGRDVIWPLFVSAVSQHPLFGQGIGTYRVLIDPDDVKYIGTIAAHNEYLRLSADMGMVGLGLLVLGHVLWFRGEWRHLRQAERVIVIAFATAFALHSVTDNTLIAPQAIILYGWLATLLQRARMRAEAEGRLPRRRAPLSRLSRLG